MAKSSFPRYARASRTGNKGVRIVESIVHDELYWVFREQEGQKDFGIDAHIELMDGDKVLGRMFAAQIKCGKSYFKSKNEDGFVYRGEPKHLNYFINYSTPVIVILCDPLTKKCYWREVDARDTDETETGWEITVPFDQTFDASAKDRLAEMAGSAEDYLPQLQQYWLGNKVLLHRDNKIVMLVVDRHEHIERGDITDVLSALRWRSLTGNA